MPPATYALKALVEVPFGYFAGDIIPFPSDIPTLVLVESVGLLAGVAFFGLTSLSRSERRPSAVTALLLGSLGGGVAQGLIVLGSSMYDIVVEGAFEPALLVYLPLIALPLSIVMGGLIVLYAFPGAIIGYLGIERFATN